MRARIAAACAAVLVGLSPAGALPFASVAGAVACHSVAARSQALAAEAAPSPNAPVAPTRPGGTRSAQRAPARTTAIWRTPSGFAPSQAPPAARA